MSDPEGLAIARRLIAEEAEQQTEFLDLGRLGLTELPEEIHQLTHLRRLNLGRCFIDDECKFQGSVNLLAPNDFSNSSVPPLRFPLLKYLTLDGTSVSDLSPMAGLTSLQSLDCRRTSVSDLSPVAGLTRLQSLDCRNTSVIDLSPLVGLTGLQSLDFRYTSVSDLSPLAGLTRLQSLDCGHTSVSDLSPLTGLTSLQSLDCSFTLVSDLTALAGLTSLHWFYCSYTAVSGLYPLAGLTKLQLLDCSYTAVRDLSPLAGLMSLQLLSANCCNLTEFPKAFLRTMPPMKLQLFETRIPVIPAEVLSQDKYDDDCRERLLAHVTDLAAGAEPVTDVKVIVIGNGRIGKTQICNRLRNEPYEEDANSTHGIIVNQTPLPMPGDALPALLNLWDFGGQDLYHGTHALFLKSRALFVVVWTPLTDNNDEYEYGGMRFRNQPLPYWLDYVRHAAGTVCPVVLVQNQCDTPQDEVFQPPADPDLLRAFPYLQQVHYSAKENRKRETLNEALSEAIRHLRGQEGIATIGKGRMKVRRQLQTWLDEDSHRDRDRRQHRTLTQQQFHQLCADAGDVSSPDSLLEYLHNAGIVFHQRGLFRDEIILDQSWALDAIYTVFNREQCHRQLTLLGGRFNRSLLEALAWPVETYSREEQELFLSLMESCGICFKWRDADPQGRFEAEYVAPDLLPDRASVASQLAGRWDEAAPKTERAWRFDFLHPGLVRSIISAVGRKAGDCAVYWKYGVWFYDATTRASAVIAQEMQTDRQGRIVLQTQGDRSRDLLESVTEWIGETISRSSSADCEIEEEPQSSGVERAGTLSPFAPRKERSFAERMTTEVDAPPHTAGIAEDGATGDMSPAKAIQITDPPRPPNERRACVSYAWKEERSSDPGRAGKVEEFCSKLTAAGIKIIRDTTNLSFGDQISKFMREMIGNSDRVYLFLSEAYLKSPNCMFELLTIWRTSAGSDEEFRRRICAYKMPGLPDLSRGATRLEFSDYWDMERDKLNRLLQGRLKRTSQETMTEFKNICWFADHVDEMLAEIADVLQPREFDQFINGAIDELHPGDA